MTMMMITIIRPEGRRVFLPRRLVLAANGSVHSNKRGAIKFLTAEADLSITCRNRLKGVIHPQQGAGISWGRKKRGRSRGNCCFITIIIRTGNSLHCLSVCLCLYLPLLSANE
jgi:hypothetical protein